MTGPPNPEESKPASEDELRMPLWEHLDELRKLLIRALIATGLALAVTYNFSSPIVAFLQRPLLKLLPADDAHLYFTGVTDKFVIYFKVSCLSAVALASPYLLYLIWSFVSPALYKHEKRFVVPFIFFGTITFLIGLNFAYFVVIPFGYKFLINFGSPDEKAIITLTEYFSLTLKLMTTMGIIFELPVALVLLAKFGLIEASLLVRFRRHAVLGIAVISAIITPTPDVFTMLIVMVPLWVLYEISIIAIRWTIKTSDT